MRDDATREEAIALIADHLYEDDYGEPIGAHDAWCDLDDCTLVDAYWITAREVIDIVEAVEQATGRTP